MFARAPRQAKYSVEVFLFIFFVPLRLHANSRKLPVQQQLCAVSEPRGRSKAKICANKARFFGPDSERAERTAVLFLWLVVVGGGALLRANRDTRTARRRRATTFDIRQSTGRPRGHSSSSRLQRSQMKSGSLLMLARGQSMFALSRARFRAQFCRPSDAHANECDSRPLQLARKASWKAKQTRDHFN